MKKKINTQEDYQENFDSNQKKYPPETEAVAQEQENIAIGERSNSDSLIDITAGDTSEEEPEKKTAPLKAEEPNYIDLLQRLQAEFINYKKRVQQERLEWYSSAVKDTISQFLPVLDTLQLYFQQKNQHKEHEFNNMKIIYDQLMNILTLAGLEVMKTENCAFNPEWHEAVYVEKSTEIPSGKIIKVWQDGYLFKGKLLRPAKVCIAE